MLLFHAACKTLMNQLLLKMVLLDLLNSIKTRDLVDLNISLKVNGELFVIKILELKKLQSLVNKWVSQVVMYLMVNQLQVVFMFVKAITVKIYAGIKVNKSVERYQDVQDWKNLLKIVNVVKKLKIVNIILMLLLNVLEVVMLQALLKHQKLPTLDLPLSVN
jgi:hypothetical protein